MEKNKYGWLFWAEWISTALLIVGVIFTSINIYPMNVYWCLAGNFGWAIVAIAWKKWSLFTIQIVVSAIYVIGLYSSWS